MSEVYSTFASQVPSLARARLSARRSHLEVRMDILESVRAGAEKPTQIMYKANLSWTVLKSHLLVLEGTGLLREVTYGTRKKYELTDKAIAVMAAYGDVLKSIDAGRLESR